MKRILLIIAVIIVFTAFTACGGKDKTPTATPAGEAGPTKEPTGEVTPTGEATPVITTTPEPTPGPTTIPTPDPVPEGFSYSEVKERAKAEAAEWKYAYQAEIVYDGGKPEYTIYDRYWIQVDWNKAIAYYDEDGEIIRVQYFLDEKETGSVDRTHFGLLSTVNDGTAEPKWNWDSLPYTETDNQGRKTVELTESNKEFYEYDQNGNLTVKRIYDWADNSIGKEVYTYDGKGNVLTEEITRYPDDTTNQSYVKKTYSEGRLVLCEVNSTDSYWTSEMIPMPSDSLYSGEFQVSYEYDAAGAMSSVTVKTESGSDRFVYSYVHDDKGRITSVAESLGDSDRKCILEIKYFENGPILVVPKVEQGDYSEIQNRTAAFFPTGEMKTKLETGNGVSYSALKKEKEKLEYSEADDYPPDILSPLFDEQLRNMYFYPKEGRSLATIKGFFPEDSNKIVEKLLKLKDFPLDEPVRSDEGGWWLYKNDHLVYGTYYAGGGGSNCYTEVKYDSSGRVVNVKEGAEEGREYTFTYDKAGHVVKTEYKYTPAFLDGYFGKGTVTYSYDASGKTVSVKGDCSYKPNEEEPGKPFRQTFRLTVYTGDGND